MFQPSRDSSYQSLDDWAKDNPDAILLDTSTAEDLGVTTQINPIFNISLVVAGIAFGMVGGAMVGFIYYLLFDVERYETIPIVFISAIILSVGSIYLSFKTRPWLLSRINFERRYYIDEDILYEISQLNQFSLRQWDVNEIKSVEMRSIGFQKTKDQDPDYQLLLVLKSGKEEILMQGFSIQGEMKLKHLKSVIKPYLST